MGCRRTLGNSVWSRETRRMGGSRENPKSEIQRVFKARWRWKQGVWSLCPNSLVREWVAGSVTENCHYQSWYLAVWGLLVIKQLFLSHWPGILASVRQLEKSASGTIIWVLLSTCYLQKALQKLRSSKKCPREPTRPLLTLVQVGHWNMYHR